MNKTIGAAIGIGVILSLLALFAAGGVFAQGATPTPAPSTPAPATPAPSAPGYRLGRLGGGYFGANSEVLKLLGMTPQQYYTERQSGKTLADIAKEKNVTDQQIIDALTSTRKAAIDQALKDGKLTQAQADWLNQALTTMAQLQLTNPFAPGQGRGFGMFGRFEGRGLFGRNEGWGGMRGFGRFGGMPFMHGFGPFGRDGRGWGYPWKSPNQNPNQSPTPAPNTTPSGSSGA
jgi:hypothetical protein